MATLAAVSAVYPAQAADRCPLSNPVYKDIRAAANRLQERLSLGKGCEMLEKNLAGLGTSIQTAVDGLYKADEERRAQEAAAGGSSLSSEDSASSAAAQAKLKTAVGGVTQIGNIIGKYSDGSGSQCGKVLLNQTDFLEAVVDTVNGLVPYMLAFGSGSSAPLVLGAAAIGGVTKAFLQFFRSQSINMNDPGNRRLFIENACSLYIFNENYEAVQDRAAQLADSDRIVANLTQALAKLEAAGIPALPPALTPIAELDLALKNDQAAIAGTETLIARLGGDDASTYTVIRSRVINGFGEAAASRLETLLTMTEANPKLAPETVIDRELIEIFRAFSRKELWAAETGTLDANGLKAGAVKSQQWLKQIKAVLDATHRELERPGRRDASLAARKAWETEVATKKAALKNEQDRGKWIRSLDDEGQAIDNSEIAQIRDDSKDDLFKDRTRKLFGIAEARDKSPAEAWLDQKNLSAERKLHEYNDTRGQVINNWIKTFPEPDNRTPIPPGPSKDDACSQVKSLILTWVTADAHIEAANAFCRAFKYMINEAVYPRVTRYCLGRYDSDKRQYGESINEDTREKVNTRAAEVKALYDWGHRAHCPLPKRLEMTAF